MKVDIITLFPEMFVGPFQNSIVKRSQDKGLVEVNIHSLRNYGIGVRKTVDDRPYSGGPGMILRVDVIDQALKSLETPGCKKVLLDAGGKKFTQQKAISYSKEKHLIFLCGHYEGIDYRVHEHLVDEIISIGDYILTGGEIPAMVITDAIVRLIPGTIKRDDATIIESFSLNTQHWPPITLEYPQFTRPENYNGWEVPKVLLEGNHKKIQEWQKEESLKRTKKVRPDLLEK